MGFQEVFNHPAQITHCQVSVFYLQTQMYAFTRIHTSAFPPRSFFFFSTSVSVVQQRSNIPPERWKSRAVTRTQLIEVLISTREKPLG